MKDIDRVFAHIDEFFAVADAKRYQTLASVIERFGALAHRGYHEREMEDEDLLEQITATVDAARSMGESPPGTVEECKKVFKKVATEVMVMRRAILPLRNKIVWQRLDPRVQLFDEDDDYSFAIYDTLADEIQELLLGQQNPATGVS